MSMGTQGTFVAVVGQSGAGKDSLIVYAKSALSTNCRFHFPRRIITRPPDETELNESMSTEAFSAAVASGAFLFHWQAHGLSYGISSSVQSVLADGSNIIANVSRSIIPEIRRILPRQTVVLVTAKPDIIARRLQARSREGIEDQANRLKRVAITEIAMEPDFVIENNTDLETAGATFVDVLKRSVERKPFMFGL